MEQKGTNLAKLNNFVLDNYKFGDVIDFKQTG